MAPEPGAPVGKQVDGEMLSAISTGIVKLHRECFGKGPTGAKTYVLDDAVICVLRDGFTALERTLFESGKGEKVREVRAAFEEAIADRFIEVVESATGQRVVAFVSQAHIAPDLVVQSFFLDRSFSGNGSLVTDGDGNHVEDQ